MKVSDLQHHELFTAQADESLDVAADRMNWHQVGALPVLEGQHLVGIISERDLTAALAEGADSVITPVSDYMTAAPEVLPARQRARGRRPPDAGAGDPPPADRAERPAGRCPVDA